MRSRSFVVIATLVLWLALGQRAEAGRKRIVVLDFEGPQAEKFHGDVIKALKKANTVVSVDKWNSAAEELDAGKVNEKNVKKVAKKLKVDGVIVGKVEKKKKNYVIKLKLHSGKTGEVASSVDAKATGTKLDAKAQRSIKDEMQGVIDELEANRGGDDEEGDTGDGGGEGEKDTGPKTGFGGNKMGDANKEDPAKTKEEDDTANALSTKKDGEDAGAKEKETAAKGDGEDGSDGGDGDDNDRVEKKDDKVAPGERATQLSPSQRAIDATIGMSFVARRLSFEYAADLGKAPPGYRQVVPVAGGVIDITAYPLALGHKNTGFKSNLGVTLLYDRVLKINSQKRYADGAGMQQVADLATAESRWLLGALYRYPLGQGAKAPVVGGRVTFGRQTFKIAQTLPNMEPTDIPNVAYTILSPGVFFNYPATDKITANAELSFLGMLDTGAITTQAQYGYASVTGFELDAGADYRFKPNLFLRAAVRYQSIGFSFKGDPQSMTHTRDADTDQDVNGAKDVYFGGAVTIGYLY